MKIKVWCDSGANIHSCRRAVVTTEYFGYTGEEWQQLDYGTKYKEAENWAQERLDIGFEELD